MMEAVQCACGSLVGPPGEGGAGCMRGWRQPMGAVPPPPPAEHALASLVGVEYSIAEQQSTWCAMLDACFTGGVGWGCHACLTSLH